MVEVKKMIAGIGIPPEYAEAAESVFRQYSFDDQQEERPELKPNRASRRRQKFGKKRK